MEISRRYIEAILRRRIVFGTIIILLTVLSLVLISKRLQISTNFFDLYPPRHEYIKTYIEFRKMFGSANLMAIAVATQSGDIFTLDRIKMIDRITKDMLKINGVNPYQVSSITHPSVKKVRVSTHGIGVVPLIEKVPGNNEELERVKNDIFLTEGIRGAYVSADNKSALIYVGFWEETDMSTIFGQIRKITDRYKKDDINIYITGYPMLYAWIYHYTPRIVLVFVFSGLVLILLLYLNFRRLRGVVIPMISAGVSGIWAFGFAAGMNFNVDLLIFVVPILLMGRTLSHSVQLLERYYEEYEARKDKKAAIIETYSRLFSPAVFGIVTDGAGVFTIAVSSIPLMQKLAFIGGFWIISMIVSVLTFQPLLQSILPSRILKESEKRRKKSTLTDILNRVGRIGIYCCRAKTAKLTVLIPLGVILVGGFYSVRELNVGDTRPGATIFFKDHAYNTSYKFINERFWGTNELIVILEGKEKAALKDPKLLANIEKLRYYMSHDENLGGSMTFLDLIHRLNRTFHDGIPKWEVTPSDQRLLATLLFLLESNSSPGEMSRFYSTDYKNASLMFYYKDYSNRIINDAIERAKKFIKNNKFDNCTFRLAGGNMGIAAAVNSEVEWSYWVNLLTIFIVVILICIGVYKSLKIAAILILPLIFAQVMSDLIMLWFKIDLNINSLPVASIGVGVGIDYGIYMIDRIRSEYGMKGNYIDAINASLSTTGRAVIFTAFTMISSVIFWVFSGIKFHAEMGSLISLLMLLNMIGAMTIVPAAVIIFRPFGKEHLSKGSKGEDKGRG